MKLPEKENTEKSRIRSDEFYFFKKKFIIKVIVVITKTHGQMWSVKCTNYRWKTQ